MTQHTLATQQGAREGAMPEGHCPSRGTRLISKRCHAQGVAHFLRWAALAEKANTNGYVRSSAALLSTKITSIMLIPIFESRYQEAGWLWLNGYIF